jgi:hypothetical protein
VSQLCVHKAHIRLGNVLTNETDVFFSHQFNESAACRTCPDHGVSTAEFDPLAIGCERQSVEGKRVKACTPREDWQTVLQQAGVGKAAEKGRISHTEL